MSIDNQTKPSCSDGSWAKRLVREFGKDIPVLPKLKKGEESTLVSVNVPSCIGNIIEELTYHSKLYSNRSETLRAILDTGTRIHYHINKDLGNTSNKADAIVNNMLDSEEFDKKLVILEILNGRIKQTIDAFDSGLLSADRMDDIFSRCIAEARGMFGDQFASIVSRNIEEIKGGASVVKMSRFAVHGGSREGAGRPVSRGGGAGHGRGGDRSDGCDDGHE